MRTYPSTGEPSADQLIAGIQELQRHLHATTGKVRFFLRSPKSWVGGGKDVAIRGTNVCSALSTIAAQASMFTHDLRYHVLSNSTPDKAVEDEVTAFLEQSSAAAHDANELTAKARMGGGLSAYVKSAGPGLIGHAQRLDRGFGPRDPIADIIGTAEDLRSAIRQLYDTFSHAEDRVRGRIVGLDWGHGTDGTPHIMLSDPRAEADPTGPAGIALSLEGCRTAVIQPLGACIDIVRSARATRDGDLAEAAKKTTDVQTYANRLERTWNAMYALIDRTYRVLVGAIRARPASSRREDRNFTKAWATAGPAFTSAAGQMKAISAQVTALLDLIRNTGPDIDELGRR